MNSEVESVTIVAERIRALEDRLLDDADILARTKERLIFDPAAYHRRTNFRVIAAVGLFTAAAAAALLMLVFQPKALTVQANGKSLGAGAWISSSAKKATTLSFSDGSSIQLNAASGLRVRDLTPDGAHILLERGTLDAAVKHRNKTRWKLDVGPYVITVVGTKFHVGWSPETETFDLKMLEGTVEVNGPMVAARTLQEGEALSASLTDGTIKISIGGARQDAVAATQPNTTETATVPPAVEIQTVPQTAPAAGTSLPLPEKRKPRASSDADQSEWRNLADRGRYGDAVLAAEKEGFRNILKDASAKDLLALGDAARHAGEFSLAADAYKTARRRYADSTHASGAAFALGIMAFDGRRDYAEAARWFSICMKDKQNKTLSREASGRLMESYRLLGDMEAAAGIATDYLTAYPNGPHAALARRLTQ